MISLHRTFYIFSVLLSILLLTACGSSPKVSRIDPNEITDLSGAWNDTDSRFVSEEMISDALQRPWITSFVQANKHQPAIIVGEVRNLSHEHINVNTFIADIERALVNSGRVRFVASKDERVEVREERVDQDLHASEETRNAAGRELGADFMLKGSINTIIDGVGKTQARFYQIDLSLISLANNSKVWLGQKKIKKAIKRPVFR